MVDLQGQYLRIKNEIDDAINKVVQHAHFINGPEVKTFSQNLEEYLDVGSVIPCANGTDALQIALMALELKPGDEVITTPFTFVATAEVIALLGLKPVFVDVYPDTFNMDERQIASAITEKTKCIIPIHLFGQSSNMEAIMTLANKYNIEVVEDNAQAIGAEYRFANGTIQKAGTIGHIGTTSFFPSKNLGCYGDGGALMTNDSELSEKIQRICNHGSRVKYYHTDIGVNSRLDTIQAAVLDIKLKHLDDFCAARQSAAFYYNQELRNIDEVTLPIQAPFSSHVYHQYTIRVPNRDEIRKSLSEKGIPTAVYYPVPLHLQTAYVYTGYKKGDFPVSEALSETVLSLPMHTELSPEMQDIIIEELKNAIQLTT